MKEIESPATDRTERFLVGDIVVVRYTPPVLFDEPVRDCRYRIESISPTGRVMHLSRLEETARSPFGPRRRVKRNRFGGFATGPHDIVLTLAEAGDEPPVAT